MSAVPNVALLISCLRMKTMVWVATDVGRIENLRHEVSSILISSKLGYPVTPSRNSEHNSQGSLQIWKLSLILETGPCLVAL